MDKNYLLNGVEASAKFLNSKGYTKLAETIKRRHGLNMSTTEIAKDCGVSRDCISQRLKKAYSILDNSLFDEDGNDIEPTLETPIRYVYFYQKERIVNTLERFYGKNVTLGFVFSLSEEDLMKTRMIGGTSIREIKLLRKKYKHLLEEKSTEDKEEQIGEPCIEAKKTEPPKVFFTTEQMLAGIMEQLAYIRLDLEDMKHRNIVLTVSEKG